MKPIWLILMTTLGVLLSHPVDALRNPAAAYCEALGYEYTVEKNGQKERGYCVLPDGQKVDAWEFLQGKVGQEYNYCALKGYGQRRVKDTLKCLKYLLDSCLVCILEDGREVEVTELMGLDLSETIAVKPPEKER